MVSPLVGIHVAISEIGILFFLWAFVEIYNSGNGSARRARVAAFLGTTFFFLSWISGGYYYVTTYGPEVKPVIKSGPNPWAHSIAMETKEHIFLILPFLSLTTLFFIERFDKDTVKSKSVRKGLLILTGLTVALGIIIAILGYLISTGFRAALEAGL